MTNIDSASVSNAAYTSRRMPVRWPFRLLAGLIVLAGSAVVIGMAVSGWSDGLPSPLKWQLLVTLPGLAWLMRLAGNAAIKGKSPPSHYWPFASAWVFLVYVVVFAAMPPW